MPTASDIRWVVQSVAFVVEADLECIQASLPMRKVKTMSRKGIPQLLATRELAGAGVTSSGALQGSQAGLVGSPRCGAEHRGHICTRKAGHKGEHKCGKGVVDIPYRICDYRWLNDKVRDGH